MTTAAAGGMMLSVFTLTGEALQNGAVWPVIAGLLSGAAFFWWTAGLVSRTEWRIGSLSVAESRQGVLVIVAMFIHSIPEGIAIGVGYATWSLMVGLTAMLWFTASLAM